MLRPGTVAFALCLALAGAAPAQDPAAEQLVFTGASVPGTNTLTFANNVYTFTFSGDETLQYQIDLSDPKVAGGMLRIRELSSDSYPIDGGGPGFRDAGGLVWVPESNYNKTTLTAHSVSGKVLTLDFQLNFNGLHPFRYEISAQGKQLRIRLTDPAGSLAYADNFQGLAYGKSTGVENPVPIRMQGALAQPITMFRKVTAEGTQHFFVANMLDMFQSNASDYRISGLNVPIIGPDSTTYSLDTLAEYRVLTDGTLAAPLDDTLILVVSSRIGDVLVDSTAPPTPYRNLLASRMFFSAPSNNWESYEEMFDQYLSLGMYNVAGYFFLAWSSSAIDPPSTHSVGPDWWPAVDPPGFESALQAGTAMGTVLGAYMSFNCMPATAPAGVWDPSQVVKNGDGTQKTYFGLGHPLIGVEASGQHAQAEAVLLEAAGAGLAYLDIQTYGSISKGPDGGHLDQDASSAWAKTMREGYAEQKGWFEGLRDTFAGPLLGEGSIGTVNSNMEFLYYGYSDSVQRCINTSGGNTANNFPAGSPFAPTNWPIIPEYEWRVAARRQVNHGNGFYERFFGPSDGPGIVQPDGLPILPLTQEAMDLYQAFLVSYGHSGFLSTNGAKYPTSGYLTHPAVAQTYFMTNALQILYYGSEIAAIRYLVGGEFQTFEQVISASETLDTFRHVPLRLDFANGLKIIVNHADAPLAISEGGLDYVLPAKSGWYADMGDGWLVAFSAIPPGTGGQRIDYCRATGLYEYFNGRGQVAGYGGITTDAKFSKWTVTPTNLSVTEDAAGKLTSEYGLPPELAELLILPDHVRLQPGEKAGLKAVAVCTNGGLLDLSTVLDWYSTDPGVASVNESGVVTGVSSGEAKIVVVGQGGGLVSEACSVRVN
jgi:hypothetical protein